MKELRQGKRTHGHARQCGDFLGEGSIRGLKGNTVKHNKDVNIIGIKINKRKAQSGAR